MTRVFVSGIGAVSAHGLGADLLWKAARDGESGIVPIEFGHSIGTIRHAARLNDYVPADHFSKSELAQLDRFAQFALIANAEAMAQAGLTNDDVAGERTAVIIGTGIGGAETFEDCAYTLFTQSKRPGPFTIARVMANAAASQIGMRTGAQGTTFAVSSACSSANQAMGVALALIRAGIADRVITGGSETMISPGVMRSWETMRVLTPDLPRPFSSGRNGMAIGEGAGVIIFESEECLAARGGTAIAEIKGYGTTADAADLLRPDTQSVARAMSSALEDAGIASDEVDYVNAHGTATVLNDVTESDAIRITFGDHAEKLAISSTKPIHGHCLGASGALEMVITIGAMREGFLPPTINHIELDPKCGLDVVPNEGRPAKIRNAISNSFAFGGINAVLVVAPPP